MTIAAQLRSFSVDIAVRGSRQSTRVRVLDGVDLTVERERVTALVGESGCGKSMVAAALTGLLPPGSTVSGASIVDGIDLAPDDPRWRGLRGHRVGLVPQSAATSFTPVRTVGDQLDEVVTALSGESTPARLCADVGLPPGVLSKYPHEISGGMAQRAAVAAAIAGRPEVLIADEPTASLDPVLAQRIWHLLADQAEAGAAVLVVTHDLETMRRVGRCDSVALMRSGRILRQESLEAMAASDDDYVRAFTEPVI
ncbi:ATP-binding cassette domain-containing protein [Gordonia soli]|uniref:Putative ABC transporter ATP-binding protein n=1 Tax=Gordonia soli NBRC 108243 TaxID=1223545 RepID=M0QFN6_9ACTN|nr:ATP-binding cassette domain-containing protein [Gordonia soli]GAC67363.1 putative ABC transporter ATP-binding protein [Gordonia soli NBRC 108243]